MSNQGHAVHDEETEKDLIFDLLGNPRRRHLVQALHAHEGSVATVTKITDEVAALEYEVAVTEVSQAQRKRVYVSLYQTHLPKLEDAGILRLDRKKGTIQLTGNVETLGSYTDVPTRVFPLYYVYFLSGILSALFLTAVVLDFPLFAAIPDPIAGFVVLAGHLAIGFVVYVWADTPFRLPDTGNAGISKVTIRETNLPRRSSTRRRRRNGDT